MTALPSLSRLAFWIAAGVAYILAIAPGDPGIVSGDKGNHALAFAALGLLARLGWPRMAGWKQAVALTTFGGLIELSQAIPFIRRDASWADLGTDAVFAIAGLALGALLTEARRRASPDDRP